MLLFQNSEQETCKLETLSIVSVVCCKGQLRGLLRLRSIHTSMTTLMKAAI
jgi:hypothetical protein